MFSRYAFEVLCASSETDAQGVRSETHVVGEPTGHAMQRRRPARGPRENKRRVEGRADKSCELVVVLADS